MVTYTSGLAEAKFAYPACGARFQHDNIELIHGPILAADERIFGYGGIQSWLHRVLSLIPATRDGAKNLEIAD